METKSQNSLIINEGLIFVLTEITKHSPAKIMGYFMDRGLEISTCPTNVFKRGQGKRPAIPSVEQDGKILVLRGYYPNTCISYKLSVFTGSSYIKAWVEPIIKNSRYISKDFQFIREAVASESLLDEVTFKMEPSRPKAMTPTGATPQHFRKTTKKKANKV